MIEIIQRVQAVQTAIDDHFEKPLDFKVHDCIRLVQTTMTVMGHDSITKGHSYSSETGAKRALLKAGFSNLVEAIDSLGLRRIAPAEALGADVLAYEADSFGGFCLGVAMGDGQALAYADGVCKQGPVALASFAWRVHVREAN